MTRDEIIKILMTIQAAYPNYKPQDKTITVNVWLEMLGDITYGQACAALKAYIQTDTKGFAPGVGEIRNKVQAIFTPNEELNETKAWSLVLKALRRSGYYSDEEFSKLPEVVQRSVGSPKQLKEWATLEDIDGKTLTVIQSSFQRTFRVEQQREQERTKLSPDILSLMPQLNSPQIENKSKKLSIQDQRAIDEENSVPMPDRVKEKLKTIL